MKANIKDFIRQVLVINDPNGNTNVHCTVYIVYCTLDSKKQCVLSIQISDSNNKTSNIYITVH